MALLSCADLSIQTHACKCVNALALHPRLHSDLMQGGAPSALLRLVQGEPTKVRGIFQGHLLASSPIQSTCERSL
jgi:hypothetical protein